MNTFATTMEPLIRRKIFTTEEQAGRELQLVRATPRGRAPVHLKSSQNVTGYIIHAQRPGPMLF